MTRWRAVPAVGSGELLTSDMMNECLRDNLEDLKTRLDRLEHEPCKPPEPKPEPRVSLGLESLAAAPFLGLGALIRRRQQLMKKEK